LPSPEGAKVLPGRRDRDCRPFGAQGLRPVFRGLTPNGTKSARAEAQESLALGEGSRQGEGEPSFGTSLFIGIRGSESPVQFLCSGIIVFRPLVAGETFSAIGRKPPENRAKTLSPEGATAAFLSPLRGLARIVGSGTGGLRPRLSTPGPSGLSRPRSLSVTMLQSRRFRHFPSKKAET